MSLQFLNLPGDGRNVFNSVPVRTSPLAVQCHIAFDVTRNPRRRRRAYMVQKRIWSTPCAYRLADGTLIVHPEILAKLRRQGF